MLLSYYELIHLIGTGVIDADPKNVNGTSIDVRLGKDLLIESPISSMTNLNGNGYVDLSQSDSSVNWSKYEMSDVPTESENCIGYRLKPGEFVLGHTVEKFRIPPNLTAEFRLRSSMARNCINASLAVWIDPWFGHDSNKDTRLTLELQNISRYHTLLLKPGIRIGQVVFFRSNPVPYEVGYAVKGRYNGQYTAQASLGHGTVTSAEVD